MAKTAKGQGMRKSTLDAMYAIRHYLMEKGNEPTTFSELNQEVQRQGMSYTDAYNALQNLRNWGELKRVGGTHKNNVTYALILHHDRVSAA